jgi:hypothetical protein
VKLAVVAALGALVVGLGVPAASAPAMAAEPSGASVSLAPADFGGLDSGTPLRLFLTIDDQVGEGIAAGSATVTIDRTPLTTRTSLANWFAGTTKATVAAVKVATPDIPAVLPGETSVVSVSVPAKSLRFGAAGVYAIAVSVQSGGDLVGTARTAVAWKSDASKAVPVALAAPLTVRADNGGFLDAKTLEADTAPDGVLTRELTDLGGTQVAIGIDPRIIASINVLGKSAPQSAIAWLQQLKAVTNQTFPLAWADADITGPLQAGQPTVPQVKPLDFAIQPNLFASPEPTSPTPSPTPTVDPLDPPLPTSDSLAAWNYTLPELSWPAENSIATSDLPKLEASNVTSAIVSSGNVTFPASKTPSGASATIGGLTAAVSDSTVSGYLREAAAATTRADWTSAMAKLTTTLDLVSITGGATPPILLATFGRDWDAADSHLTATLGALYSRDWVVDASLADVLAAKSTTAKLLSRPELASRVALIREMFASETRVQQFSVVTDPDEEQLTSTRRLFLLSLLSNEWAQDPGWTTQARDYVSDSHKIVNSVKAIKSSTVTFLNDQGSLPITVNNSLAQAVTVYVAVRPRSTLLSVEKEHRLVKVQIAASSQKRVEIPVQSVANGKVGVRVTLYSANGRQVGTTTDIDVNVQAGWETIGTLIFGALVVAIFAFGIIRNVRKRRRERRERDAE